MLFNNLQKCLGEAINGNCDRFLLYYTGHGETETGGWITHLDGPSIDFNSNVC